MKSQEHENIKTEEQKGENFKDRLRGKMDKYVHHVYKITRKFPKEELYGATSQIRRAAMSIILNYIEGYARRKPAVQLNFFEISYGSLQETKYIIRFSLDEHYIERLEYEKSVLLSDEIGAMLWTEIKSLDKSLKK